MQKRGDSFDGEILDSGLVGIAFFSGDELEQELDEPALRMAIERVLNGVEYVHRFTRAVSVGNPREFLRVEKQEQEMAEACKRLIKNCIICWNFSIYRKSLRTWMIRRIAKRF